MRLTSWLLTIIINLWKWTNRNEQHQHARSRGWLRPGLVWMRLQSHVATPIFTALRGTGETSDCTCHHHSSMRGKTLWLVWISFTVQPIRKQIFESHSQPLPYVTAGLPKSGPQFVSVGDGLDLTQTWATSGWHMSMMHGSDLAKRTGLPTYRYLGSEPCQKTINAASLLRFVL